MNVGNVVLRLRNDDMGIGNNGVDVHNFVVNVGNGHIRVDCKFGLESRQLGTFIQKPQNAR